MASTTGTQLYDVAPTVFKQTGPTAPEVLAQQSQAIQEARAKERAQREAQREEQLKKAYSAMENIEAENWTSDSQFFEEYRQGAIDRYTEVLARSNGNPTMQDLAEINSIVSDYNAQAGYSMQDREDYQKFQEVIKSDKYDPEAIEQVAQFYNLPYEQRRVYEMQYGRPQLKFKPELVDWNKDLTTELSKLNWVTPYAGASMTADGSIRTSSGDRLNEEAINTWVDQKLRWLSGTSTKANQMYKDISEMYKDELLEYDPESQEYHNKFAEVADKYLRERVLQVAKTGQKSAGLTKPGGSGDGPWIDPNFVLPPDTPGEASIMQGSGEYENIHFDNQIPIGNLSGKGAKDISAPYYYDKGKKVQGQTNIDLDNGGIIYEGVDLGLGDGKKDYIAVEKYFPGGKVGNVSVGGEKRTVFYPLTDASKTLLQSKDGDKTYANIMAKRGGGSTTTTPALGNIDDLP